MGCFISCLYRALPFFHKCCVLFRKQKIFSSYYGIIIFGQDLYWNFLKVDFSIRNHGVIVLLNTLQFVLCLHSLPRTMKKRLAKIALLWIAWCYCVASYLWVNQEPFTALLTCFRACRSHFWGWKQLRLKIVLFNMLLDQSNPKQLCITPLQLD